MRGGMSAARRVAAPGSGAALSIGLSAVIVSATTHEPRVLTVRLGAENAHALPFGPLEVEHRTLEIGLRSWVERQTGERLGYVEQLYTFGDRDRPTTPRPGGRTGTAISRGRIGAAVGRNRWRRWSGGWRAGSKPRRTTPSAACARSASI